MTPTILAYVVLFLVKVLYVVFLDARRHHWGPDWIWVEVATGVGLCLIVPFALNQMGLIAAAAQYEHAVWISLAVGGAPVIGWQVWRAFTRRNEAITYTRNHHDTSTEMAETM